MGGVCQDPEGQYFVWKSPFSLATQARLVSYSIPKGDMKTNNLEIGALLMQLLIFILRMAPLVHIHTYIYNTAEQGWSNRGSVRTSSYIGPVMW